jgi:hypothetical protein
MKPRHAGHAQQSIENEGSEQHNQNLHAFHGNHAAVTPLERTGYASVESQLSRRRRASEQVTGSGAQHAAERARQVGRVGETSEVDGFSDGAAGRERRGGTRRGCRVFRHRERISISLVLRGRTIRQVPLLSVCTTGDAPTAPLSTD